MGPGSLAPQGFLAAEQGTGRILDVNEAYCLLCGFTREELVGHNLDRFLPESPLLASLEQARTVRFEGKHYRKGLPPFDAEINAHLYGNTIVGFITDIANSNRIKVRLEALCRERTRQLEASNEALQSFAYAASHDLREPLNKISAFGSRLRDKYREQLDERGQQYLDVMITAAERMTRLIDDLLIYSRSGHLEHSTDLVDLNKEIRTVLCDLELPVKETKAQIKIDDLPTVKAHATRMRQVLQNLLSNALKFHKPEQPPVIWVSGLEQTGWVGFRVKDDGIGFDQAQAQRIFTLFTRLHTRFEYPGTGIGLATCKRILDSYGGTITAQGSPDGGAEFTVKLPIGGSSGSPSPAPHSVR